MQSYMNSRHSLSAFKKDSGLEYAIACACKELHRTITNPDFDLLPQLECVTKCVEILKNDAPTTELTPKLIERVLSAYPSDLADLVEICEC